MKTIRDTKLFKDLIETDYPWRTLFLPEDQGEFRNSEIPNLLGGIDHIEYKKKGVYFHDIGCNNRDNSFVIRPELEQQGLEYAITYKQEGTEKPYFLYDSEKEVAEAFYKKVRGTAVLDMIIVDNNGQEYEAGCDGSYFLNKIP